MPTPADMNDLTAAIEIATTAGKATLEWFHSPDLDVDRKGDGFLTVACLADHVVARLAECLDDIHPDQGLVLGRFGQDDG